MGIPGWFIAMLDKNIPSFDLDLHAGGRITGKLPKTDYEKIGKLLSGEGHYGTRCFFPPDDMGVKSMDFGHSHMRFQLLSQLVLVDHWEVRYENVRHD
jgi:hypothetical protein